MRVLKTFLKDRSGATAIEYGLIAAGVAVVIVGAVTTLGDSLKTTFETINTDLTAGSSTSTEATESPATQ